MDNLLVPGDYPTSDIMARDIYSTPRRLDHQWPEVLEFVNQQFAEVRSWVGPIVDSFRLSYEATTEGLRAREAPIRYAAVFALEYGWEANTEACQTCNDLILSDPDERVKAAAISYIITCYQGSKDPTIAKVLAQVVMMPALSDELRLFAYSGILRINRGYSIRSREAMENLRFPGSVNWAVVEKYLRPE